MAKEKQIQYYPTSKNPLRVRLYPNKTTERKLETRVDLLRICCNHLQHAIYTDFMFTNEKVNKKTGKVEHWVNKSVIGNKNTFDYLKGIDPRLEDVPAAAFESCVFGAAYDVAKHFTTKGKNGKVVNLPVEATKPKYYSKSHPRTSFGGRIALSKICQSDNKNVVRIWLDSKIGWVKARGWNHKLRFGENADKTFFEYADEHPNQKVTYTISIDNCNQFWCSIKLGRAVSKTGKTTGFDTYTQYAPKNDKECGVDTGVSTAATVYDAETGEITKYENPGYASKTRKDGGYKDKLAEYDRRSSNAYGPKNPEWRKDNRAAKKNGTLLEPSNNYKARMLKKAKLSQKVKNKRDDFQHKVTREIVDNFDIIDVETLDVASMLDREKAKAETGSNRGASTKNRNTADAAMSSFNARLKYKAEWAGRQLNAIGQYERSTGVCPVCGYVVPGGLSTDIREWTCPQCGLVNDRDGSAAEVICAKAKRMRVQ